MVTVRCVLSLAVQNQWSIFQLDVNNAFLYGELDEDVYMSLPDGYFVPVLTELGFNQNKNDHSLFVKSDDDIFVVLLVYVDDIIITDEFGMLGCRPASTPIEVNLARQNQKIIEKDDYPLVCFGNFQKLVGKLIYLTITRPDISYVVHKLSQVMHGPLKSDLKLAFRVLRCLKGAPRKGVSYNRCNKFELSTYVDSDWAKCNATRRSVTGYADFLGSCLVLENAAMQIAANPVFHERTKHFEIDLYFLREKIVVVSLSCACLDIIDKLKKAQGLKVTSG
ncbi:ribonuclease H-like domain-containing protein [Tanacetum coccineum]